VAATTITKGRPAADSGLEAQTPATATLRLPVFPLSAQSDTHWILRSRTGLNASGPTGWLCQEMVLRSGMRTLDPGCGKTPAHFFRTRE
jgi:hypothetical protein